MGAITTILLILVFGLFGYPGLGSKNDLRIQDLKDAGVGNYNAGDFNSAAEKFAEGLRLDGNNSEMLAGVIGSLAAEGSRSGRESEALRKAEPYLQNAEQSNDRDVLTSVGYLAEINGDYEKAIKYYDIAIQKEATFGVGWFHRGHAFEFLGNKEEAAKSYQKAYEISPDDPKVLLAIGRNKALSGDINEAYDFFMRAANGSASNRVRVEAYTNASALKRSQGYIEEALELSRKAYKTDSRFGPALSNHGINLAVTGRATEGINLLRQAMELNARSAQPYWWLAIVLRSGKQFDEAISYQKKALEMLEHDNTLVGPQAILNARALMNYDLAKTYDMAGNKEESLKYLIQSINLNQKLAENVKSDIKFGFFKSLSGDWEFESIIN